MGRLRKIVFACSFGPDIGIGHAGRCSSLAQFAKLRGVETVLWSDSEISMLPAEMRGSFDEVFKGNWKQDALPETVVSSDCIVIDDMYSPDGDFDALRQRIESRAAKPVLLAVDDMKLRRLEAVDLVLNQEIGLREAIYECRHGCLLGESFALLRQGLAEPERYDWNLPDELIPVMVMIGGTDPFRLTVKVIEGLSGFEGKRFAPLVVAKENHPDREAISESLSRFESWMYLSNLGSSELAGWLRCCKFAVIGCGTSIYEMAAMKIPFIGLQVVDNQRSMGEAIAHFWKQPIIDCEEGDWREAEFSSALHSVIGMDSFPETDVDLDGARRVLDSVKNLLASRGDS